MNDLKPTLANKPDRVTPSASDPIDRWLDVFIRLLRLPKADAQRIRDELEDHLRARVDDLMLTGSAEPEAVRIAVAELGETAELARQFQSASKPPRRLTMLAGSAIVSAGLITGAMLLTQSAPPPASAPAALASAAGQAEAAEAAPPVFESELVAQSGTDYITIADAVHAISTLLEARVIPHYRPMLAEFGGIDADTEITPPSIKGLTLDQGLDQLSAALELPANDPLVMYPAGESFEIATQSFFDERDAVLIEYDVSGLLTPPQSPAIDPYEFQNTVQSLIEPELWGTRARLGMVSTTMIVNAHPRVHAQVADLLARIETRYGELRAAKQQERRNELETQLVQLVSEIDGYNRRITELTKQLEKASEDRRAARERIYHLDLEANATADEKVVPIQLDRAEAEDELRSTEARISELSTRRNNMEHSLAITKGQIDALQAQLAPLGSPAAVGNTIYVGGNIYRPGAYALSGDLTARRAVAAAGGGPGAIIELTRVNGDKPMVLQQGEDAKLLPGDLLRIR